MMVGLGWVNSRGKRVNMFCGEVWPPTGVSIFFFFLLNRNL